MKTIIAVLGLPLLLLGVAPSPAAEPTVVTVEGKYAMGDLDTKKDARTLAIMEAKRIALEKAGTYIESSTEVKNFSLTKDQINTLAAGIMSVDVLKEEWKMAGENMVALVLIRATIDTTHLRERIHDLHDEKKTMDDSADIRKQLAVLQQELAELREKQGAAAGGKTAAPELKEKHDRIMNQVTALDILEGGNRALDAGQRDRALSAFTTALAMDSSLSDAYAGQAIVFYQTDRTAEAMEKIDAALKLDSRSPKNYIVKAMILKKQGKYELALASLDRAIELKPRNPRPYMLRGSIYATLKRPAAALEDLARACNLGNPGACDRIKQLKQKSGGRNIEPLQEKRHVRPNRRQER